MFKTFLSTLTLLILSFILAKPVYAESVEEAKMLELINWIVEESAIYEYNDEPLPKIVYATQEQLGAYFYGLDTYLENEDKLIPIEGIFRSADEGTMFLLEDFDWESGSTMDVVVHELVHYLQYINGRTFSCSVAGEIDAYKFQSIWLMDNPIPNRQAPTFLTAVYILETCIAESLRNSMESPPK
jgi:hypothetical protein